MTRSRSDLSIVKVWDSTNKKWREITCEKPKIERKHDMNIRTACNSKDPYEVNPGTQGWTVELPGVAVKHEEYFTWVMNRQTSRVPLDIAIAEFRYDTAGKVVRQYLLQNVYFETMTQEGNEAFDLKGGALKGQR
jgi:hypothetical protein